MYCQTCGNLLNENLNYCNRCGSKVIGSELTKSANLTGEALSNLSASMGYVGVAGLGGFVGLIAILIGNSVAPELVAVIALIFAATAFGICFLMMRQMSRITGFEQSDREISNRRSAPEQLNVPITGQIEAPRQPFASVTENTTRTLDDVLAKGK
jgi:hypothetical protein